ncbi:MAG: PmoA family protein [Bryobacterales bacterium]|nr:PmoA family protein [Bryobacterales bacterium]
MPRIADSRPPFPAVLLEAGLLVAVLLALMLLAGCAPQAQSPWLASDESGRLLLMEDGRPVLGFNHGPQLANGAPEHRRREGYVYPLYTPAGVSPLDDFPEDHWHHRGLFWAWPVIEYEGKTYDIWTLGPGITLKHLEHQVDLSGNVALLQAKQAWYVGETRIVKEDVALRVNRAVGVSDARDRSRTLEIEVTLEATGKPVLIGGQPDQTKGYGGMNLRFAPRTSTRIFTPEGEVPENEDMTPHAWATLEAQYGGKAAGVRVESLEGNPGHPQGWCLRPYGFLGANYPGTGSHLLEPGMPLTLRYRVTIYDGRRP